jgi:3-phosphoglycerate kinase
LTHKMTHVSTGGGAALRLFEGIPLPAVEALPDK